MRRFLLVISLVVSFVTAVAAGKRTSSPDGAFIDNPMLWADVPDPDILRVGDTYYMVSTTMHLMPGAPIMRSKDLKNWETVNYIFDRLTDSPRYDLQQGTVYGRGQWATSLQYHKGKFYALFSANEQGAMGDTYIYTTEDIEGKWTLLNRMRHFHDASLFFDDDDRVYVIYATGQMVELKADLSDVKEGTECRLFKRGPQEQGLLEGSRMVKHHGRYYLLMIAWPKGGHRLEVCYRADHIRGPYERRIILDSEFGGFGTVGQGTIVDSEYGDWYAIIFQDRNGVGRVPMVMPCRWIDGWPMLGDELGRVPQKMRPLVSNQPEKGIVCSDDFAGEHLGLHWQWNHNPVDGAWSLTERAGWLRLKTARKVGNLFEAPNTLTQRMEGPACSAAVKMDVSHLKDGDCAGFAAFNDHSGVLTVKKTGKQLVLEMSEQVVTLTDREKAVESVETKVVESIPLTALRSSSTPYLYLRIDGDFTVGRDIATFYYSTDGEQWQRIGSDFKMRFDWQRFFMGTKYALFCYATKRTGGWADFDDFNYQRPKP